MRLNKATADHKVDLSFYIQFTCLELFQVLIVLCPFNVYI